MHDHVVIDPSKVAMALVHRPGSEVVDLPAGKSAEQLEPGDFRVVEMPDVGVAMATIHRPCTQVVELPAGTSAEQLDGACCRVVEAI